MEPILLMYFLWCLILLGHEITRVRGVFKFVVNPHSHRFVFCLFYMCSIMFGDSHVCLSI